MCKVCRLWGVLSPSFCFATPAVQISITNISPCLTPRFQPVERPWLATIHVQIGPKSSNWNLWCECFHMSGYRRTNACRRKSDRGLWFHPLTVCYLCTWLQKKAATVRERLYVEDRLCCVSALRLCLWQLPLVIALRSNEEKKASNTALWGKYLLPLVCFWKRSNIAKWIQGGAWPLQHWQRFVFNPFRSQLNVYICFSF